VSAHQHHHGPPPVTDFDADRHRLGLYYRAMAGRACELVPYDDDVDVWQHPDTATTVRLPARAPLPPALGPRRSAAWYRVALAHRAMHQACGTFELDLDRDEPLFVRHRPSANRRGVPHLEQFLRCFSRTALAVEVLAVLEDLRIDTVAMRRFPGLTPAYTAAMRAALSDRPDPGTLPPRGAVAEALVRFTLGAREVALAESAVPALGLVTGIARRLLDPRASVESTAEATIRVYSVLAGLPNLAVGEAPVTVRFDDLPEPDVEAPKITAISPELRLEGDELFDVRFVPVRFRDVPGPRYLGQAASGMPLQEAILRMTPIGDLDEAPDADEDGYTAKSIQAERGDVDVTAVDRPEPPPEPLPHDHGPDLDDHHHAVEGALRVSGKGEFLYPEWDEIAGRYLPDWCLVRVRESREVRSAVGHRKALARHGYLLPGLVRQLERMHAEGRDLATRQPYGHDLDLDACIEAMVDLRTGVDPRTAVFSAFAERIRDVAVAIAIDLSSSTAERLPESGRSGGPARILDLQRDAVALLSEALDRIGDSYGIYGFSGTGRADCRISVVKELDDQRSLTMLHRLQGLRPDHTTRMAPAIRHLTRRLENHSAASRILLIISDGRPFDLDYGQQYGDDAVVSYALSDTGRALDEARRRGVWPYLITVDPEGSDYLADICEPVEYHVIANPRDLPSAVGELYRVARHRAGQARYPTP
jgi:nitric oxide reductase NorD protein